MANSLFDNPVMTIDFHSESKILDLNWKAESAKMSVEDFRATLALYAVEAVAQAASGLLVDAREFRFDNPGEVEEWRQRAIIPLYRHAGVRRFAYLWLEGFELPPALPASEKSGFTTRYFHEEGAARAWFGRLSERMPSS